MKLKNKILFPALLLLSVLFIGFTFTSCSDDDNDMDYAKEIVGTYTGTLSMKSQVLESDVRIEVLKNSNTSVTLKLNQKIAALEGMVLNIQCPSIVTYDEESEEYVSEGSTSWNTLVVKVNGLYYDGKKADIDISVGNDLYAVNFYGTK